MIREKEKVLEEGWRCGEEVVVKGYYEEREEERQEEKKQTAGLEEGEEKERWVWPGEEKENEQWEEWEEVEAGCLEHLV